MSYRETLLENERSALTNSQFISRVSGKSGTFKKKSGFSAVFALVITIGILVLFFASSSMLPAAISERLIEETDVQYADAVESKLVVFQQALVTGDVPDDTAEKLMKSGVEVGYIDNGEFIKGNKSGKSSVLKFQGKIIEAKDFLKEANQNATLYEAFNNATYSRAAYYYDEAAQEVFKRIGTNRNNFNAISDFDVVADKMIGEGSNINVNSVVKVEKTREENGETVIYYEYENLGNTISSEANNFVIEVANKNRGANTDEATLNAANTLNIADTISKEQRSELLFLAFMENISKMKAGEGNSAKVNEVMNRLYETSETKVVDVNTGEIITVSGSMVESPSLYAILSGGTISSQKVENYSSDRILKLVGNKLGTDNINTSTINGAITSTGSKIRGSIGRFINNNEAAVDNNVLTTVTPIINSSLINNSYSTMIGVDGGEMMVEGAVSVGRALAKASGATAGSAEAVKSYARLTTSVLALDAEVDRKNRSPFDITSKNTFLGSILYNMATSIKPGSLLTQFGNIGRMFGAAFSGFLPSTHADDETERYLANFGDCKTLGSIGAVGSVTCSEIVTFDTSTLDNIFDDPGFISFIESNTTLSDTGVRTIKNDSVLANFIDYNNNKTTQDGPTDGGIVKAITNNSNSVPFITDILSMVKESLTVPESTIKMATGESFVNSSSNSDWDTYKYAQRYVSLARATESLRRYSNDKTAYTKLKYFEGNENPVVAYIRSQNSTAAK